MKSKYVQSLAHRIVEKFIITKSQIHIQKVHGSNVEIGEMKGTRRVHARQKVRVLLVVDWLLQMIWTFKTL